MLTAEFKEKALRELKEVSPERMVEILVKVGSVKIDTQTIFLNEIKEKIIYTGRTDYVVNDFKDANWQDPIGEYVA